MRVNDQKARRFIADYLNREIDLVYPDGITLDDAKEFAAGICARFGEPGGVLVSDKINDGNAEFRMRDPETAIRLAVKIGIEQRNLAKAA